jgi:hypothetical protein
MDFRMRGRVMVWHGTGMMVVGACGHDGISLRHWQELSKAAATVLAFDCWRFMVTIRREIERRVETHTTSRSVDCPLQRQSFALGNG